MFGQCPICSPTLMQWSNNYCQQLNLLCYNNMYCMLINYLCGAVQGNWVFKTILKSQLCFIPWIHLVLLEKNWSDFYDLLHNKFRKDSSWWVLVSGFPKRNLKSTYFSTRVESDHLLLHHWKAPFALIFLSVIRLCQFESAQ